ncbi:uncharacterized protein ARMOST_16085 [Armillaria ostoyae]|uniref:Uncharacterized protein n=1 Tax=Armillaria ostoyae TaxID=47428 RepID=A0A284RVB1_ARMOS|nr:uncharacterized protein ARMOST_16085 [Armillaria ostoyae]
MLPVKSLAAGMTTPWWNKAISSTNTSSGHKPQMLNSLDVTRFL